MNSKQSYVTDLEKIDNIIIVWDFNTSLSPRQYINKETLDLNHTLVQMNLTDMYKSKRRIHFLFKYITTLSMTEHIIGTKRSLSKIKKKKDENIFSGHNGMKRNQQEESWKIYIHVEIDQLIVQKLCLKKTSKGK